MIALEINWERNSSRVLKYLGAFVLERDMCERGLWLVADSAVSFEKCQSLSSCNTREVCNARGKWVQLCLLYLRMYLSVDWNGESAFSAHSWLRLRRRSVSISACFTASCIFLLPFYLVPPFWLRVWQCAKWVIILHSSNPWKVLEKRTASLIQIESDTSPLGEGICSIGGSRGDGRVCRSLVMVVRRPRHGCW